MAIRVTIVPGDGIGPEVIGAARRAIEATGVRIEWDRRELGMGTPAAEELIRFVASTTGVVVPSDTGISVKEISEHGSERIARFAFGYARANARAKVTASHKANIMKFSDGLFLEVVRRVAREYPEIEFEDRIIDALCMHLVQTPERFDVLVLPNMYGDLVAELCAGVIGGAAVAPGGHFGGSDGRELAVFEATHGTAPRLAGVNRANPVGATLSGAMMLRHLGEAAAADAIEAAVAEVLRDGTNVNRDLRASDDDRPTVGPAEMPDAA